tara:strand:+ start:50 stop:406 length:357 start_codon:yes stop_codon:yes gene_type:complete
MAFKMKGTAFYGKSSQSPISQKKQQGPINKENEDLLDGEHEDTYVYKGSDKSERIGDYEDRAEFAREDAFNAGEDQFPEKGDFDYNPKDKQEKRKKGVNLKNAEKLQREADIIRDRDE